MAPRPVHPGEILREMLEEMNLSATRLAADLDVPPNRITAILRGKRAVTADTALRLGEYFGQSPRFWLNLQANHDLVKLEQTKGKAIRSRIRAPKRAPAAA